MDRLLLPIWHTALDGFAPRSCLHGIGMASAAVHRRQRHDGAHPACAHSDPGTVRWRHGVNQRVPGRSLNMFKWWIPVVVTGEEHGR